MWPFLLCQFVDLNSSDGCWCRWQLLSIVLVTSLDQCRNHKKSFILWFPLVLITTRKHWKPREHSPVSVSLSLSRNPKNTISSFDDETGTEQISKHENCSRVLKEVNLILYCMEGCPVPFLGLFSVQTSLYLPTLVTVFSEITDSGRHSYCFVISTVSFSSKAGFPFKDRFKANWGCLAKSETTNFPVYGGCPEKNVSLCRGEHIQWKSAK